MTGHPHRSSDRKLLLRIDHTLVRRPEMGAGRQLGVQPAGRSDEHSSGSTGHRLAGWLPERTGRRRGDPVHHRRACPASSR